MFEDQKKNGILEVQKNGGVTLDYGISTACLYPMETAQGLNVLLENGFTTFEIFFNTCSELQLDYVGALKDMLEKNHAKVKSIHPFTSGYEGVLLFSNYEPRFQDSLRFYEKYFQAAVALGAEYLILHGMQSKYRSKENEERYFKNYAILYALGRSYGIEVLQENVTRFFAEDPEFVLRMRSATKDQCGFCLDIKQAIRSDVDCYEMLEAMGDRLLHIHLSDNARGESCLLPGAGEMDLPRFLRTLKQNGFDQTMIIEVYRTNFSEVSELTICGKRLQKWIADIEKMA